MSFNTFVQDRYSEIIMVFVRITFGFLWLTNAAWKMPPLFGLEKHENLYFWISRAVEYPVVPAYSWLVEHVILTHFLPFAWAIYVFEIAIGLSFVLGFRVRLFAIFAFFMGLNIALSVLNTPGEWYWSYIMILILAMVQFAHPYSYSIFSLDYWIARFRINRA